jgi:hypothetical protein
VVANLKHIRNFIERFSELGKLFARLVKRLKEVRFVDMLVDGVLRRIGEIVDSMVQKLDREKLEELVREAVRRKVDELLESQVVDPKKPNWLRDLAKNVMTYRYGDYVVLVPNGKVKPVHAKLDVCEKVLGVKLPSIDTLADVAVREVRSSHEVRASFEKRLPGLCDSMIELLAGKNAIASVAFKSSKHGTALRAELWASGLVALGLAEKVKPGTTEKILREVKEVVGKRLRGFIVTDLFYSMFRELSVRGSRGGWRGGNR